jgi:benzodiazapine receptor
MHDHEMATTVGTAPYKRACCFQLRVFIVPRACHQGSKEIPHALVEGLLLFLLLAAIAGAIGSPAVPDAWYAALAKPSFNPPNWIFAPVWTLLYIGMAIAAWRVYRAAGWDAALGTWVAQLVFNGAWSPLFFGLHRIDLALADIRVPLALVVKTTALFFRRDRIAGSLMVPYAAWVSFATLLTGSIGRLNPH